MMCNPHSVTVVFNQPEPPIVRKYQLVCNNGIAHAIVMPSMTDDLLDQFAADFLNWQRWMVRQDGDHRNTHLAIVK